jgi:DNA polymerase/3'-5' exonuclease PolX
VMNEFAKKLVAAVMGNPAASEAGVEPYVAVARKIMEVSGINLGTKAELDVVRKCQADYAAGLDVIKKFNYNTFKSAWLAHRKDLEESVRTGQIHSVDGYGETEFEQEHIMKMEAGKAACRAASRACIPVARKLAEQFGAVADKLAANQEADERRAYTKFDLKFPGGSPLLELLKTVGEWARARVPQNIATAGCGSAPESMLPYLDW